MVVAHGQRHCALKYKMTRVNQIECSLRQETNKGCLVDEKGRRGDEGVYEMRYLLDFVKLWN